MNEKNVNFFNHRLIEVDSCFFSIEKKNAKLHLTL